MRNNKADYQYRVGEEYNTNEGYLSKIIRYGSSSDCDIILNDSTVMTNITYLEIKRGAIRNPYFRRSYNIGYQGQGNYGFLTHQAAEQKWRSMLRRCYSEKCLERDSTYKDVTVCEEWHNFQNFAQWHEQNWDYRYMNSTWNLDKDILIKDNKIYSPETCCFVPQEINKLLTIRSNGRGQYPIGVIKRGSNFAFQLSKKGKRQKASFPTIELAFQAYKTAKENYIKEVADKWKDKISDKVYQSLINYKVEITD